ncbi:hypothetical protein KC361_g6622 [Hortaea werneckii]|nr:hypothetical protein KC361_g6622 [Hortaea werneckii]
MLVALHKEETPIEEHPVAAARLDAWILIDLVLKERLESRMAEPPSDAGFRFEEEHSDYLSGDHGDGLQARAEQSHFSSAPFSKDALQRCLRDTITLQERKQAHFLPLAERNSESDSDLEVELPSARRLRLLSRREDRRMARLIRDCPQPSTCTETSVSTKSADPMSDSVMSGAISPDPSGYLVTDCASFVKEHQINDARAEQPRHCASMPTPCPSHRTTPSEIPEEEQKTILKPTKRTTRASLRTLSDRILLRSKSSFFSSRSRRKNRMPEG